ncbi:hypothetical protein Tco_0418766 [Tanacetum coccineum]
MVRYSSLWVSKAGSLSRRYPIFTKGQNKAKMDKNRAGIRKSVKVKKSKSKSTKVRQGQSKDESETKGNLKWATLPI